MTKKVFFPFQESGAEWLSAQKKALLADEPGLGKTAQAIHGADIANAVRILVFCPAIARANWVSEFYKFSKTKRDVRVFNSSASLKTIPNVTSLGVWISSYDSNTIDRLNAMDPGQGVVWDLVILDEVHLLKSFDAKRTSSILGKNGIVHRAKKIWALSGTPATNHAGELWPLLYVFGLTRLKYEPFVERFCDCERTTYGLRILGTNKNKIPELKEILNRIMLRRRKKDVLKDLPPLFYGSIVVEPGVVTLPSLELARGVEHYSPEILKKESAQVEKRLGNIELGIEDMESLAAMAGSVSTLRKYTGLQKVVPCSELVIEELESGAYGKIVIFAVHKLVIEQLSERLKKFNPLMLYGKTSDAARNENIRLFQTNPNHRVLVANILSAGTAITLTAAHHVLFVEQDWVPANNSQAAQRCHRIGQTETVSVRFAAIQNGVDERLTAILKRKSEEIEMIFET